MTRRRSRRVAGVLAACASAVLLSAGLAGEPPASPAAARVEIDPGRVRHTMAGGLGASWHALSRPFTFTELNGLRNRNARGSAWGGNPPLDFEEAWSQLYVHAAWLGLDWLRVEISERIYQPRRGELDLDNEEMRALYRILDWSQAHGAEVFLTRMWGLVDWNKFDGIPALQSAPRSVDDLATGLGALLDHLVNRRGYTSIKWLCLVNEPNARWWLGPDGQRMTIEPALAAVRSELDRRRLEVGISAPGWSYLKEGPKEIFDVHAATGVAAYDAHSWGRPDVWGLERWVELARARGIPFFLSELGDMRFGWKYDNAGPASWGANLSNAEKVIAGLNLGVDAFNRWSFTNRGDLDGQFQLVRTWDRANWEYLRQVSPEPVPYYAWGILTRFAALGSRVLETEVSGSDDLLAAAIRSPRGKLTLYLLNRSQTPLGVVVSTTEAAPTVLHRYAVTEAEVQKPGFELSPRGSDALSAATELVLTLPPSSITALSAYELGPRDPGVMAEPSPRSSLTGPSPRELSWAGSTP